MSNEEEPNKEISLEELEAELQPTELEVLQDILSVVEKILSVMSTPAPRSLHEKKGIKPTIINKKEE